MNNEEIKKSEETELQKTEELSDEEMNQVAGGWDDKSAADENYALAGA